MAIRARRHSHHPRDAGGRFRTGEGHPRETFTSWPRGRPSDGSNTGSGMGGEGGRGVVVVVERHFGGRRVPRGTAELEAIPVISRIASGSGIDDEDVTEPLSHLEVSVADDDKVVLEGRSLRPCP